jgi:hypothetical protein
MMGGQNKFQTFNTQSSRKVQIPSFKHGVVKRRFLERAVQVQNIGNGVGSEHG